MRRRSGVRPVAMLRLQKFGLCTVRLKIIAPIMDPPAIIGIRTHLGLPVRAPPRAPAHSRPLFQAA